MASPRPVCPWFIFILLVFIYVILIRYWPSYLSVNSSFLFRLRRHHQAALWRVCPCGQVGFRHKTITRYQFLHFLRLSKASPETMKSYKFLAGFCFTLNLPLALINERVASPPIFCSTPTFTYRPLPTPTYPYLPPPALQFLRL